MPGQSEGSNHSTAIFLSLLYAIISIIANTLTILPDTGEAEFRLGIFVPALAAIIYGPMAGGLTAGIGNLLIDTYGVIQGSVATLSIDRFLGSLANFVGGYATGWFALRVRADPSDDEFIRFSQIPALVMSSVIGLALMTGGLIGYGILFLYLNVSYTISEFVFESIFFYNSAVLIVMMTISLGVYKVFNSVQLRRFRLEDEANRELNIEYVRNELAISKIELPAHSLWVDEWTPLTIEVRNNEKSGVILQFEAVSDALVFPQVDRSHKLNPGESFLQTFYLMPKQEKNTRIRLHVKQLNQRRPKSSVVNITAMATVVYTQDSLSGFSSVNILVFAISVFWSNIVNSLSRSFSFSIDNVIIASTFIATELLVLLLYIYWKNKATRKWLEEFKELDFVLTSEHTSYRVKPFSQELFGVKKKRSPLLIWTVRLISGAVLAILLIDGYRAIFTQEPPLIPNTGNMTFIIYVSVLVLSIISEVILSPRGQRTVTMSDDEGNIPLIFTPSSPFKVGEPNEVTVTVVNTVLDKGLRVIMKSSDFVAPEVIELHVERGQQATFKISITPLEIGTQNLLFAVYPLFSPDGKYIDFQEAEPVCFQTINYHVLETTVLGMTSAQFEFLTNMGGLGTIIVGVILTMNRFVGIDNLILKFRDLIPLLVLLQIPVMYLYFSFNNRYVKSIRS